MIDCPRCDAEMDDVFNGVYEGTLLWCDQCGTAMDDRDMIAMVPECSQNQSGITEKERDLIDTVSACLIAAGASEDLDEMERQVKAAGTKPSHFVQAQFQKLQDEVKQLRVFARDVRDNWDCDDDSHKYGTSCRCSDAEEVLRNSEPS